MTEQEGKLQLASSIINGLLERDSLWSERLVDDLFYKKLAQHTVALTNYIWDELNR